MLSFIQIIQTTCMLMYYTLQFFSVPKCFFLSRRNFKGQQTLRNVDQSLHFLYFEFENSAKSYAIQLHFVVECQVLSLIYCIIMFFFLLLPPQKPTLETHHEYNTSLGRCLNSCFHSKSTWRRVYTGRKNPSYERKRRTFQAKLFQKRTGSTQEARLFGWIFISIDQR